MWLLPGVDPLRQVLGLQFSLYDHLVYLASDHGAAQVRLPDGTDSGFRMPDYPEANMLTDARDYNPILAV